MAAISGSGRSPIRYRWRADSSKHVISVSPGAATREPAYSIRTARSPSGLCLGLGGRRCEGLEASCGLDRPSRPMEIRRKPDQSRREYAGVSGKREREHIAQAIQYRRPRTSPEVRCDASFPVRPRDLRRECSTATRLSRRSRNGRTADGSAAKPWRRSRSACGDVPLRVVYDRAIMAGAPGAATGACSGT